jgi:LL-diaminopimelate aminotransferase
MSDFRPAHRLDTVPEYVFSRLTKAVREVEQDTGRKVLDLGAGTPDVQPSRLYSERLADLVQAPDAHTYPGYGANAAFSKALRSWYRERFNVELAVNELFPLNGAKDGITHLPLALLNNGEGILVPDPGYPSFSGPAELIGAEVIPYTLDAAAGFAINYELLAQLVSAKTRYIWVNFPSNPTGQVASLSELEALVAFARQHDLFILYDNAYSEITFDGFVAPSILQVEGAKELAIEIGSFSKSFSFAGFRMGWVVGHDKVIAALAKVKSQLDSGLSAPLQELGAFALTNPDAEWQKRMITSYKQRREIIAGHLKTLGLNFSLPHGSLYIWAKIPENETSSEDFCMRLLKERQILITPGSAFGPSGEGYVRVSISVNIDAIEDYF